MAGSHARRFLGVTLLTLCAGAARAGDGRASFTVSATVVRSAAVRVTARPDGTQVRVEASAPRSGGAAGLALAAAGERGAVKVAPGALSAAIAARPGAVVVTVLPDGAPAAIRLRD